MFTIFRENEPNNQNLLIKPAVSFKFAKLPNEIESEAGREDNEKLFEVPGEKLFEVPGEKLFEVPGSDRAKDLN
jgi:hypothetical protein